MKKDKSKIKAFIDSDIVEVTGSKVVNNPKEVRKKAAKNLKDKIMNQLVKSISERAVDSELYGDDPEETARLVKKANKLKKSRTD